MKIVANSIPKGGTHLLLRLLALMGYQNHSFWIGADLIHGRVGFFKALTRCHIYANRMKIGCEVPTEIGEPFLERKLLQIPDGCIFGAHCNYDPRLADLFRRMDVRAVCILRDPRSIAVSHMHYLKKANSHFFHRAYLSLKDDEERIRLSIEGGRIGAYKLAPLDQRYRRFVQWSEDENAVMVRFEDLVGPKGGGRSHRQRKAIEKVAVHLGCGLDESELDEVQAKLFGTSSTFRKGSIDSWRTELTVHQKRIIHEMSGDLLKSLGYEESDSWVT